MECFLQRDFGLQTPLLHNNHQAPFFLLPHSSQLKQINIRTKGASYQLAASSQTRPRTQKPACVYTAHGGRKSASRGAGSRGSAQVRAPFQVGSPSPPKPGIYELAEAHIAKEFRTLRADSAAVRDPPAPPCPRAASATAAPLTPRSAGGSAPQQVTRLGSLRGAGALPRRGCGWHGGARPRLT